MIVRPLEGTLAVIHQDDHARQCGVFAAAWPNVATGLATAAAEHDNGWREWDAAPRLDESTGRPFPFFAMPLDDHLPIYRRGIQRAAAVNRHAGVLVSLHGCGLYNGRYGVVPGHTPKRFDADDLARVEAFLAEQEVWQDATMAELGVDRARAMADYALLQFWDVLSLACLTRDPVESTIGPIGDLAPIAVRPTDRATVLIDPYPFTVDPLPTQVPFRRIADRRYDQTGLQAAIDAAPIETLSVTFRSSGEGRR